jgi:hypothetical protein
VNIKWLVFHTGSQKERSVPVGTDTLPVRFALTPVMTGLDTSIFVTLLEQVF